MQRNKVNQKVGNDIYGVKSHLKYEQRMGETAETGFRHNDHYHKYFHGYTELRMEKENGKYSIERYYTEDWYVQDLSDKKRICNKLLYGFLTLFSAGLYFGCMITPDLEGNKSYYVSIPGLLVVIPFILLLASAVGYIFTKRKMTWWECHTSSERIKRYSLMTSILLLITSILIFLNIFFGVVNVMGEAVLGAGVLISAAASYLIFILEERIVYKTEKNNTVLPAGEAHLII